MGIDLLEFQTTLSSAVSLKGIGVHSGKPVTVTFHPAEADTGVLFQRVDEGAQGRLIPALASEVGETDLSTSLGNPAGDYVATVEHLMAAVAAMGVDNVLVEIDSPEVPIMDGSASAFVEAFTQAGIRQLSAKRRYIRILKPVRIDNGSSWAEFRPHDGTRFEVEIDFDSPGDWPPGFCCGSDCRYLFHGYCARAHLRLHQGCGAPVGCGLCAWFLARELGRDR